MLTLSLKSKIFTDINTYFEKYSKNRYNFNEIKRKQCKSKPPGYLQFHSVARCKKCKREKNIK